MNRLLKVFSLIVFTCAAQLFLGEITFAANGETAIEPLRISLGAKASAMGSTQYGAEGDSFAQFYNPSLLTSIERREIGFMHNQYLQSMNQDVLGYVHPTLTKGVFAAGVHYFNYGSIQGYDSSGVPTSGLTAYDLLASLSWAKSWGKDAEGPRPQGPLSTGLTFKFIQQKLNTRTASAVAADLGLSYPFHAFMLRGLRLGAAIQNVGTDLKHRTQSSPLPRSIRVGGAYSLFSNVITLSVDGILEREKDFYSVAGVEYRFLKSFSVRAGYKGQSKIIQNFSYGAGFESRRFRLDYAYVPYSDLGDSHRVSVQLRFGVDYKRSTTVGELQQEVREAEALYAQDNMVDAYMKVLRIKEVAPWLTENNNLLAKVEKEFAKLQDEDKKQKLNAKIMEIFNEGVTMFDNGNLINAQRKFRAVLSLHADHREAQAYLKQIETQFVSLVDNFFDTGLAAFAEGDILKAKQEFERVLAISPDHERAKSELAKCNQIISKQKKEVTDAHQRDILNKMKEEALSSYKKKEYEKAIELFDGVLRMGSSMDVSKNSAWREEIEGYIINARDLVYRRHLTEGKNQVKEGEWKQGIVSFNEALKFTDNADEVKKLISDAGLQLDVQNKVMSQNLYKKGLDEFLNGKKAKAKEMWEKALELDPGNVQAKRGLERVNGN